MILFDRIDLLQAYLQQAQTQQSIGFVPTMGALHEGHLALIKQSMRQNTITVCSIFVNQLQFNQAEDFTKYPRSLDQDIALLEKIGCHCLFIPTHSTVFPENYPLKTFDLGNVEHILEGFYRPGHFQGVCQVVKRLLDIVRPTNLYLGMKDFQQCIVIDKMMQLEGFNQFIKLHFCDTVRNEDGLALSSRNKRLSPQAISKALGLINNLKQAKSTILNNPTLVNLDSLQQASINSLINNGFESVDYFTFMNEQFEPIHSITDSFKQIIILVAATIEGVRLIDNIIIKSNEFK